MTDPWKVLGIPQGSSEDEVNKAYKKLAMQFHPDRNPGNAVAEERFKEINAARDTVRNQINKPENTGYNYNFRPNDPKHPFWSSNSPFDNIDDMLSAIHAQQQQQRKNRDIQVGCQISLEDAFFGTTITVSIPSNNGNKHISVSIPAGIEHGQKVRVPQCGEHKHTSLQPGDLYVVIAISPHQIFTRVSANLFVGLNIDLFDILLGCNKVIKGIDGTDLEVKIPRNFDPEKQLRLAGHGMPITNARRADLFISIRLVYSELTSEQLELISQARDCKNNMVD